MPTSTPLQTKMEREASENAPAQFPPDDAPSVQPGYHIVTWGCQMNEEDSEQMSLYLEQMGYRPVSDAARADVVLLNTCSVRAKPEEKVWSELGKLRAVKQERPELIIGVCGCMAQVESAEIRKRAPHVDMVVGTGSIAALPAMIRRVQAGGQADESFGNAAEGTEKGAALSALAETGQPLTNGTKLIALQVLPSKSGRARTVTALDLPPRKGAIVTDVPQRITMRVPKLKAHVPIMYGCDKFCTFCIVPHTRGRERSRPTTEILEEIEGLAQSGTKEITLLGQTVNSYGKNMLEGRVPFCELLEQINAIRGLQRIRFTSPYPRDFTDDLIDAIGGLSKVCEYVHLPLQVGDDDLLREMHRGYTLEKYLDIVAKLRTRVPGIAISTDIMLGYPGETDAQFWNTMRVVEQVRFDSAFMFAYSPRPNTKAAVMENQVPQTVKIERLQQLVELQNRITCEVNAAHIGQTFEVMVEGRSPKDATKLTGLTRTFKTVNFAPPAGGPRTAESLIGKLVPVRVLNAHLWGFAGEYAG